MIILVVDINAELQANIAKMLERFDARDRDALDLQVSLATPGQCLTRVAQTDVLIIGPGLGQDAHNLARQVKKISRNTEIIFIAPTEQYTTESFRQANSAKIRKVLHQSASPLDLLQEIVFIHEHFRSSGRAKKGKLVVVTQAKGGIGSTSLIAGLAEYSHRVRNQTLLWDLDIESRDLTRALNARGTQSAVVTSWIADNVQLTSSSLREAFVPISSCISLLPPPHGLAAGLDLISHHDSIELVSRIVELAKVSHDTIIVDTAGKLTSTTGTLLRMADEILLMVDDSLLGLSAAYTYLESIMPLLKGNEHAVRIVRSGTKLSRQEISKILEEKVVLDPQSWVMPSIPIDQAADRWAGTGSTMYSLGHKTMKRAIEAIATELGIGVKTSATVKKFPAIAKQTETPLLLEDSPMKADDLQSRMDELKFKKVSNA